jgi:hypothetical protein
MGHETNAPCGDEPGVMAENIDTEFTKLAWITHTVVSWYSGADMATELSKDIIFAPDQQT